MQAVVLDGSGAGDGEMGAPRELLVRELQARGWQVDTRALREAAIAPCRGCFGCWITTPGTCVIDDDNRALTRAVYDADLVALFTPITFGGYSSTLKRALDHWIPLISPFFRRFHGETHHPMRYARRLSVLGVGVLAQPDAESEDIFRNLLQRNARNLDDARHAAVVWVAGQGTQPMRAALTRGLGELEVTP